MTTPPTGGQRAATAPAQAGMPNYILCLVRRNGEPVVVPLLQAISGLNDMRG
jgi:hypothetical protein